MGCSHSTKFVSPESVQPESHSCSSRLEKIGSPLHQCGDDGMDKTLHRTIGYSSGIYSTARAIGRVMDANDQHDGQQRTFII